MGLLRSGCGVVLVLEFVLWELGAGVGVGFVDWVVVMGVRAMGCVVGVCVGVGVWARGCC